MPTWIKFCGTTCLEDALASIEAGADALGFIFAPSKRQVTPAKAQEIISKLPRSVERIGVFQDATNQEIATITKEVDLTGIQLHGRQKAREVCDYLPRELRGPSRIIQTVQVKIGFAEELAMAMSSQDLVDAWLIDSGAGSGQTFDWPAAQRTLGAREARFIIAGGLTPENVEEAIGIFSPWGVDAVSGIESAPGRKDPNKMREFAEAVRKAESK